jgi:TonB family protein
MNYSRIIRTTLIVVSVGLFGSASAHGNNDTYYLKGDPIPGSKIHQKIARSSVPLNLSYARFTDKQKAIFNRNFNLQSTNSQPPFPKRGLQSLYRPIIEQGQKQGIKGQLNATLLVNKNGFVEEVKIQKNTNQAFNKKLISLLEKTRFEPAQCNGQACSMTFPVSLSLI